MMNMPEVSVGPQPVTTTQCETWEATGVQERSGVTELLKKDDTVNLSHTMN